MVESPVLFEGSNVFDQNITLVNDYRDVAAGEEYKVGMLIALKADGTFAPFDSTGETTIHGICRDGKTLSNSDTGRKLNVAVRCGVRKDAVSFKNPADTLTDERIDTLRKLGISVRD